MDQHNLRFKKPEELFVSLLVHSLDRPSTVVGERQENFVIIRLDVEFGGVSQFMRYRAATAALLRDVHGMLKVEVRCAAASFRDVENQRIYLP